MPPLENQQWLKKFRSEEVEFKDLLPSYRL